MPSSRCLKRWKRNRRRRWRNVTELLDIGAGVETGSYRLHSRFHAALAFTCETTGSLVWVVDESKPAGAVNLVVRDLDWRRAHFLEVRPDIVWIGSSRLAIGRRSAWRLPRRKRAAPRLARNLAALRRSLIGTAAARSLVFLLSAAQPADSPFARALADRFRAGVSRLTAADAQGAEMIRGLGFGLTPGGDDFLAGFLLGLWALDDGPDDFRQAVAALDTSRNPFSAALLANAVRGCSIEPAWSMVDALFTKSYADVARHSSRLAEVGASSGADLATGLYFGLKGAAA